LPVREFTGEKTRTFWPGNQARPLAGCNAILSEAIQASCAENFMALSVVVFGVGFDTNTGEPKDM
jgi:hypothetical protein